VLRSVVPIVITPAWVVVELGELGVSVFYGLSITYWETCVTSLRSAATDAESVG
jgi:hypothetical protein